jgi:GMP reductase
MIIETDLKLDFNDVLIRPKRSTLASRKDVDLMRTFNFKHSKQKWTGVPIMASNMDGVGTFSMAEALQLHDMFTCIVKSHDVNDWKELSGPIYESTFAVSTGTSDNDYTNLRTILKAIPRLHYICIDVANGYSEHFGKFVSKIRSEFPSKTIIAGNVVTADMTQELILQGADIVKVGIGCFVPGSLVLTKNGMVPIEQIKIGNEVLTHTAQWKCVVNTLEYLDKKEVIKVNNIKSTPNHEFYVLHKKYRDVVNDNNIHQYAQWVSADQLTKDFLLIKHK